MTEKEIIKKIVEERKEQGATQEQLAKAASYTRQHWAKIEHGSSHPSLRCIAQAAEFLGMSITIIYKK